VFYNDSAISLNLLADSKDALIADNWDGAAPESIY
jgi:hypothetical protein